MYDMWVGYEYAEHLGVSDVPFVANGVVVGYPFSLQKAVDFAGKEIIPDCLGIYHLFYQEQLVYVGMSKSLRGRLLGHLKDPNMPFTNVLWFCAEMWKGGATVEDVLRLEYEMIKRYKPVLNSKHVNCH